MVDFSRILLIFGRILQTLVYYVKFDQIRLWNLAFEIRMNSNKFVLAQCLDSFVNLHLCNCRRNISFSNDSITIQIGVQGLEPRIMTFKNLDFSICGIKVRLGQVYLICSWYAVRAADISEMPHPHNSLGNIY